MKNSTVTWIGIACLLTCNVIDGYRIRKTYEATNRIEQNQVEMLKNQQALKAEFEQLYKLFTPVMPETMNPSEIKLPEEK